MFLRKKDLPKFKYNPKAVENGLIVKSEVKCPVCKKKTGYAYEGPFYSAEDVQGICPWCIANGKAARKFDGEFQDAASCEEVEKDGYIDELTLRTPGYNGWQQEVWLSHCGDFCAFIVYVGWQEIEHLQQELEDDINQILKDYQIKLDDFKKYLLKGGDMQGYLFRCLICGKHRLAIDCA